MRLLSRGGGLNLSLWARSLSRTPIALGCCSLAISRRVHGAAEVGDLDLDRDLQDFAFSAAHVSLRSQLGLSRG